MGNGKNGAGIIRFCTVTLWDKQPDAYAGWRRRGFCAVKVAALIVRNFLDDQCLLRAAALTYYSLLSLVPFFALAFAVLKGFGVQNTLEPIILNQVAAGSQEVVDNVVTYIDKTNMTSLGTVGLVALVYTVISLLGNVEDAFNSIWGVKETRPLFRKFSDYLSVIVVGPILLLAAISITSTLHSQWIVQWIIARSYFGGVLVFSLKLVPYVSIWIALVFLFLFIPNIKVRIPSAVLGGVLAGTLWQFAQWGYIHFQVGVAKYNAIYGTLALLPIFMVWIYTSWLIVFLGVEVVCAHQNRRTFLMDLRSDALSYSARERLSFAMLVEIAGSFRGEKPARTTEELAELLAIPVRTSRELLEDLHAAGFLAQSADEPPVWQPARDLELIRLGEIAGALKLRGEHLPPGADRQTEHLAWLFERLDDCPDRTLADLSLRQLVLTSRSAADINGE
jgi:membrane protein